MVAAEAVIIESPPGVFGDGTQATIGAMLRVGVAGCETGVAGGGVEDLAV